jgi:hypothetical protein
MEGFLESFLQTESLPSTGGLFPSFLLVFPSCLHVVEWDMIVGGAVGLHVITLLLPGDDDVASVLADIDDGAEVTCGAVIRVATPPLVRLDHVVPTFSALHIDELTAFLLDVICIFYLDVVWQFNTHCCIHIFVKWIKEVVDIVV